ncbi:hypothetical protein ACC691_39205, partial [Rhizobium johnstonii]|uniref:hypothetical protein n=1 Tax=Rhizobium johnstonii TaxID=3019933 RepID=UPI003F9A7810
MARGLGLPVGDTDEATRVLVEALTRQPRRIDAAIVRHGDLTTWYAAVLSAGFDAEGDSLYIDTGSFTTPITESTGAVAIVITHE